MATKLPGQSCTTLPNFGFAKHWLGYFWLKNRDRIIWILAGLILREKNKE
jgi:hypothetical protein